MRVAGLLVIFLALLAAGMFSGGGAFAAAGSSQQRSTPSVTPSPVPSAVAEATAAALRAATAKSNSDALASEVGIAGVYTGAIKTILVDAAAIVVGLLVIGLLVANIRRIWTAVSTGGFTFTLGPFGSVAIPAQAAAAQQQAGIVPPAPAGAPASTAAPAGAPDRRAAEPRRPTVHQVEAASKLKLLVNSNLETHDLIEALSSESPLLSAIVPAESKWSSDVDNYYRSFYNALLLSQYLLLEDLASGTAVSVADAAARFNKAARATKLSFDTWRRYLQRFGMIVQPASADPTEHLQITDRGRDFIDWARTTGHDEASLTSAGRDY